jgi:hypothetical protein
MFQYRCSKCHYISATSLKWCPRCGVRFSDVQNVDKLHPDYRAGSERAERHVGLGLITCAAIILALVGGLIGTIASHLIRNGMWNGFSYGCGVSTVGPLAVIVLSRQLDLVWIVLVAPIVLGVLGGSVAKITGGRSVCER